MRGDNGNTPARLPAFWVMRRPTIPQCEAGQRTEPSTSVPNEISQSPAATDTAEPVLEPDGSMLGKRGLRQPAPKAMFSSVVATLQLSAMRGSRKVNASALRLG
ncbi:hypothetical protein D3C81_1216840 [compost metagenome]